MKKSTITILAFCIIAFLQAPASEGSPSGLGQNYNFSKYKATKLAQGAQKFPALAQLVYKQAIESLKEGNKSRAERLLQESLRLNPEYPAAYFTLARIEASRLDAKAFLDLASAFKVIGTNFHYQSLLAANLIITSFFLLVIFSVIVSFSFLIKYLPFSAHRLKEFLERKFQAVSPTFSAYLLLLLPFALFPGLITGFAITIMLTWVFLRKREKALIFLLALAFILLGTSSGKLKQLTPVTDPGSLAAKIAKAGESSGDPILIHSLEKAWSPDPELMEGRNLALGILNLRRNDFLRASDYLLKVVENDKKNPAAYINLSNVYYLQGEYEKALEGYIKAEALDSLNAVCEYNLAQAYIKTLLLARSSSALNKADQAGINKVKATYANEALTRVQVFPAKLSNSELWTLARIEGAQGKQNFFLRIFLPVAHFPPITGAWILILSLLAAIALGRFVHATQLAFQCSNCGDITCNTCCNEERGILLCQKCAATIEGISSDRVIEALLRQCRQTRIVRKRKSLRFLTCIMPGVKAIYNDKLLKALFLVLLFGLGLIELLTRGFFIKDWYALDLKTPVWKIVVPASAMILSYLISIFSKSPTTLIGYRSAAGKQAKIKAATADQAAKTAYF